MLSLLPSQQIWNIFSMLEVYRSTSAKSVGMKLEDEKQMHTVKLGIISIMLSFVIEKLSVAIRPEIIRWELDSYFNGRCLQLSGTLISFHLMLSSYS